MNQLFEQSFVLPSLFDRGTLGGTSRPSLPVNLWEINEGYTFQVALPGMQPENFDIQVMGREVSIHGKYEMKGPENGTWIWQGISGGEFHESFTLEGLPDYGEIPALPLVIHTGRLLTSAMPGTEPSRPSRPPASTPPPMR